MPTLRRTLAVLFALLLTCALSPSLNAASNPYDAELADLARQLSRPATPPETAVLLARMYRLRDFVDDRAAVTRCLDRVASDSRQHPLVRDEALRYLALIDIHNNQLDAARHKITALGFVSEWSIAGPFASRGIDAIIGPERAFDPTQSIADDAGVTHPWHSIPADARGTTDLAPLMPHAGPAVAFAATTVQSANAKAVALRFTAEPTVAVFVNGQQVFLDRSGEPGIGFDQHAVAAELHAGANSILLKLARTEDGPWRFALRITDLDGAKPGELADLVDIARAWTEGVPSSATPLDLLGALEYEHARGTALDHLEAAARRSPSAGRWLRVAQHCAESACTFAALSSALRLEPNNERALVALANYYFGRNQLEKSRDLLLHAAQIEPGDFVARNALADLYVSLGLHSQALRDSEQLQREFPSPLWLKRKLAGRYLDLGLLDRARDLLADARREDFDNAQLRSLLQHLAATRRDAAALRSLFEDALRLNPADIAAAGELAAVATGAGEHAAAERTLRAALEFAPENRDLHQRLALALRHTGNAAGVQQELARAAIPSHGGGEPAAPDNDAEYLANAAQLAAAASQAPPATTDPAVTLAGVRVERVLDNGLSEVRAQQVSYIATDQGARDYGTRSVQYAPGSQALHILNALVYKSDGRVLEADDAGENAVSGAGMYYDVRARAVRFPALEKGDVVELDYRITPATTVNPYGDYFGALTVFQSSVPQQLQRYVLITPVRRQFNIVEQRMRPATVHTRGDERVYRWEMRDLPALPSETRGPALTDVAPYVHVSTFQSWQDLGRWYAQLIAPQFALDATLRDAASRLLHDKRSDLEKISAIHQFVLRNTHYVALEFGIYSYKPYPVAQTYARRFGDCKDKASLMIALLRQAGIEADIALVRTRRMGEVNPQATSIALFNHAIVYVPRYDLWLDGTAEYAGSRELPLDDQGASALTVAVDGTAQLRHIPVTQPSDNYTRRTVRAQVTPDGRIEFQGVMYTRGENAPGLRRDYETPERQRDAVRNTLAEVFPSVHVDDVRVDGATDIEHPVTVEFRGAIDTFAGQAVLPLASSWMPRSYVQTLASLASRRQELLLPAPWTTEEELHFQLPAGAVVTMPADTALETAFGSASLRYERNGRELVVHTSVQFRKLRISPEEYAAFRDFCVTVERAFHGEIKVGLRG